MSMNRFLTIASLFVLATVASAQAPDYSKLEYRSEKLTDNLFVLFGGGGNIAVLTGPDGALVVDSDVPELSAKMRAAVSLVSDRPLRFLVNTHYHFDHRAEIPAWVAGTRSSWRRRTRANASRANRSSSRTASI